MNALQKVFLIFTQRERYAFLASVLVALFSAGALAGILMYRNTKVAPAAGGTYTEGTTGQPTYVNPVLASSEIDKSLVRLLFASVKDVAEKIEPSKNARSWNIRLKEGLTWSDGKKLTSDDILFTLEKIQDPETQSPGFSAWQGVTAERKSELEFALNLIGPYPFFEENLSRLYPVPKHLFADIPAPNWRLSEYILRPIGNGSFIYDGDEKEPNGFISWYRVKRNSLSKGPLPFLDYIVFRFYTTEERLVQAFNRGTIDGLSDIAPERLAALKRPHQLVSFLFPRYYAVFFNQGQSLALKDGQVRRALDLAVDRETMIRDVFGGHALGVENPLPPFILGEVGGGTPKADPEGAKRVLEETGWKASGGGMRQKASRSGDIPLKFDLVVPNIPFLARTAALLKDSWQNTGVQVNLIVTPPEEVASRTIKNRSYEALLFGNELKPNADLYAFWHSNERFYPGTNLSLYSSRTADELIESVRLSLDQEEQYAKLKELREVIAGDVPAVFLYSPEYLLILGKNVKGVSGGFVSDAVERWTKGREWHVKTARVLR